MSIREISNKSEHVHCRFTLVYGGHVSRKYEWKYSEKGRQMDAYVSLLTTHVFGVVDVLTNLCLSLIFLFFEYVFYLLSVFVCWWICFMCVVKDNFTINLRWYSNEEIIFEYFYDFNSWSNQNLVLLKKSSRLLKYSFWYILF